MSTSNSAPVATNTQMNTLRKEYIDMVPELSGQPELLPRFSEWS